MKDAIDINLLVSALNISRVQVVNVLELLAGGATIPFIARYRKEMTGGLDEVQITAIEKKAKELKELAERRKYIREAIDKLGKLTPDLAQKIAKASDLITLEDLFLPYKQKKVTRAAQAKKRGLEPLAQLLWQQTNIDVQVEAKKYLKEVATPELAVPDVNAALQGARDIIAEMINEDLQVRTTARSVYDGSAKIISRVKKSKQAEAGKFQDYFAYEEALTTCPSHRLLAVRRGENEGFLRVNIVPDLQRLNSSLQSLVIKGYFESCKQVKQALEDACERLLTPSLEAEYAKLSKSKADCEAINVFALNLRQLLLEAPLGGKRILALDPGFRTGCKTVCLDEQGNLLFHAVIYPDRSPVDAAKIIKALFQKFSLEVMAIGDGTASRETTEFMRNILPTVPLFVVSEAGASIYSASEVARQEFPDLDLTVRGAISIGRRLLDPLAELVKLDPKSIGVGQYQHDVDQKLLKDSLDNVVVSCVNLIGVNLNTASKHVLTYISGLGPVLAQNIVDYRKENGLFTSRSQLKKVKKLGAKAFEQCAGFLRVSNVKQPLDNSSVHPESYQLVAQMAEDLGTDVSKLIGNEGLIKQINLQAYVSDKVGLPTLEDILKELQKPGVDPRGQAEVFEFAKGVKDIKDVTPEMELSGIVTNITNFGAFVDIGVHCDGLIHISNLADHFVSNPADIVSLREKVIVRVLDVDLERKRIGLKLIK